MAEGNKRLGRKRSKTFFETALSTPAAAVLVTTMVILTGGLWSIYADVVRHAWPFAWHARGQISWTAVAAWVSLLVTSTIFFFRQRVEDKRRAEAQQELVDRAAELRRLIVTMPPANFVDSFVELFEQSNAIMTVALGEPDPPFERKSVIHAVRVVLNAIASLADVYDGDRSSTRYAANIMRYVPSDSLTEQQAAEIEKRMKFCEKGTSVRKLRGVLDVQSELSASTESNGAPDSRLSELALPVPHELKSADGKFKVLPGAPLAFMTNRPDIHVNFAGLRHWCEREGDFPQSVLNELTQYLDGKSSHMKSFISLPLAQPSNAGHPIAILNIHCDNDALLRREPESVAQFVMIIKPLQGCLTRLLEALERAEEKAGPARP